MPSLALAEDPSGYEKWSQQLALRNFEFGEPVTNSGGPHAQMFSSMAKRQQSPQPLGLDTSVLFKIFLLWFSGAIWWVSWGHLSHMS